MSGATLPVQMGEMVGESAELRSLYHRLSNELGVILAHAELLEVRAPDATSRGRAAQVVTSVLDAMGTVRELRDRVRLERSTAGQSLSVSR